MSFNLAAGLVDILTSQRPLQTAQNIAVGVADNAAAPFINRANSIIKPYVQIGGLINNTLNINNSSTISMVSNLLNTGNAFNNVANSYGTGNFNQNEIGSFLNSAQNSGSDIFSFLSTFTSGVAKSNRFRVEFTMPIGVDLSSTDANAESMQGNIQGIDNSLNGQGQINIKCHTCSFPGRSLQTYETQMNSALFRIPFASQYDPVTFSFYVDNTVDTRRYFEVWQAAVINLGDNTMNFYNEYISNVNMYIQDAAGNDIYSITLYEGYPLGVSAIDMSYSSDNTPLTVMVTMAYKSWLPRNNTNKANPTYDGTSGSSGRLF